MLVLLAQQNLTFSFEHTALFRKNGVALRWDEIERYRGPAYTQAGKEIEHFRVAAYAKVVARRGGKPISLFHYTTNENALAIFKSKRLKASTIKSGKDAAHGDGQYFTSLPPWADDSQLLQNNYDGAARRSKRGNERLKAWIEINPRELLMNRVRLKQVPPDEVSGRDIYVTPRSSPLDLTNIRHKIWVDG